MNTHQDVHGQDLAWLLERKIMERTAGRVHQLHVDALARRVNVFGTSPSYHVKQLAIQAILETVPQCDSLSFAVDIDVR